MYFLETLVGDINTLDYRLNVLYRCFKNCYHLANLQVFCNEFDLFQCYCQTILKQIELRILSCLHTSKMHRLNSYEEIGLWINDFNDCGKTFENLRDSLIILQNLIENSHKITYYTNINNVISSFDCVQQTRMNSIKNVDEIMDYLNLDHFYDVHISMISEANVNGSNIKKFILQDATLIEALDLCNNYRSFNNLFHGNKNRKKICMTKTQYDGYIKKMKHTLHNIWIILSDCYWLLLGSKLISFYFHVKMEGVMSDEKFVMEAIQSGNCTILANSQRVFSKLINHLTCYQPVLLNNSSIHAKYLSYCNSSVQYHDYFNYVKNNLNLMKNGDKNYISNFITNTNTSEEHSRCFYSIFVRFNSLFESLKDMKDDFIVGLNRPSSDSFTPVTMYTTVLNLTVGAQQRSTDKIKFNSDNRHLRTYYSTNPSHHISNYYSELYVTIRKNSYSLKCNTGELMPLSVAQDQGNFTDTSEGVEEKFFYRTCAYLSWFKHQMIPISLDVNKTIETTDCDFINKWDIFIIWQGQVNQFNDSNRPDLEQTDISFDHTIKYESITSCYADPVTTTTTTDVITFNTKSLTDSDTDHDDADYTPNDVTQITDGKFSPVLFNSNMPIDDKSHDDSAYQTLYVNDNDPINWDAESIINDSCDTVNINSEISTTLMKQIPTDQITNRRPLKQQYDFINSSLTQLEEKLSCISQKCEEMEKRNELLINAEYIKEIGNIFQLLLFVKDETSQIEYILSNSNMNNESLSINNDNVNSTVNSGDNKCTVISSQFSGTEKPILEVNSEEIYQHVSTRLSTVKCIRVDLMKRCDKLVECLEKQKCESPVNINTDLKFISQNLVSLAHKLDDPDYDALNVGSALSIIGKLEKKMIDLQGIQQELVHIEANLKQLKCTPTNLLSCESVATLDCIEGELEDMQVNLQNKIMYLNNFYKKLSDLSNELQVEFNWIKQQESDLILKDSPSELNDSVVNGQVNNSDHLERDISILRTFLTKLSQYQENKLLPMLENYDRLKSDDGSLHGLQWTIFISDTEDNMDLVQNIRNLWNKIIKELIPRKFQELITRSYEQITKNLASTLQYLPSLRSFEFIFTDSGVPELNSIQCCVNIILDHINVIQSEIDWLNQHLKPIIINEDRLNLITDTTSTTTIIDASTEDCNPNINNQIVKFQEVNHSLTQLLNYFTQIYQYLSTICIPAINKYHQIINHSLTYINTVQQQVELFRALLSSVCSNNDKDDDGKCEGTYFSEELNENVECNLIIYEKLETLCTGREQCLDLLQNVMNNHQTIINELMDIFKDFQSPFNEILVVDNQDHITTETMTIRKVTDTDTTTSNNYTSKILEPAESISQQLLYFFSEIQNIISDYDQSINTINRHKIPQELSIDWNTLDLVEDLQESELLQDESISSVNKYQPHINEFDKQYNHLLNASYTNWWPNDFASRHINGQGPLDEINKTSIIEDDKLPKTDIQSYDEKEMSNKEEDFLNDTLQKVKSLESNLKLSCCNFINNDQLKSRLNDVSMLRIDITDKITQIMKANEQLRSSSQQIEHIDERLNILKSTFIQSADLLQNVIAHRIESESQSSSFGTYAQIIRKQLSITNNVITELQELTDEFNSTDYLIQNFHYDTNNNNIFPFKIMHDEKSLRLDLINQYENIAYLPSFTVPLWYKQIKINNEVMNFLEHVKNHRQRLLFGYELAERLSIWVSVAHPRISKLKVKLQHLGLKTVDLTDDSVNLSSHLHDLTVYRLELFSQLPMIQCILKDTNEFNDVVLDLSEDYKLEIAIDCIQQNVLSDFNKCGHSTSLQAQIVHQTNQFILTIVNDFNKSLTESSTFLSATRNHLIETNQIPTILNEFTNSLNEFSCLDEKFMQSCAVKEFLVNCTENYLSIAQNQHWIKMKYIELWYNEFKSMQSVLSSLSKHQYLSTSIDKNNIQNEMKQIKLKSEQQCRYLTRKKIELTNEINKEKKLHASVTTYSVWLSQLNDKLIKFITPNHLTFDTVKCKWKEFKDWNLKSQKESQSRLNCLLKQLPSSVFYDIFKQHKLAYTNVEDFIFNDGNTINSLFNLNAPSTINERIKTRLELSVLLILRQYIRFQLQCSTATALWKVYLKFIKYFRTNTQRLCLLFDEIQTSLSTLYRPSKFVGRCTEQLNSVKDAIQQLKTNERLIINLYNLLPIIKASCQSTDVSQSVATINAIKHNFRSLMRRAIERRKILTQALNEDIKFDVAYYSLLNWLLTKLEQLEAFEVPTTVNDESNQLIIKKLHREFQQRQSDYQLVLRLGGNLRERCTCSDPEKSILNEMLEKLQIIKAKYGNYLSKCQIQTCKILITKQNSKSALFCLNEWLQTVEEQLGITNIFNVKHTTSATMPVSRSIEQQSENDKNETDSTISNSLSVMGTEVLDNSTDSLLKYTLSNFHPKEYENIVSVLGDLVFVQSLNSNHLILAENLQEYERLFNLFISNNEHYNSDESFKFTQRFIRLKQVFSLREKCLKLATNIASELNTNYSKLITWLLEATDKLNGAKVEFIYNPGRMETPFYKQASIKVLSAHTTDLCKIRLNLYVTLRKQQICIYQPIFNQFVTILKSVVTQTRQDMQKQHKLSVYCYSKYRRQFVAQYKQIMSLWHKLDQGLQCLRLQLTSQHSEQSLIDNLIEFESQEKWIHEKTTQLDRSLTEDETILQKLPKRLVANCSHLPVAKTDTHLLHNNRNLVLHSEDNENDNYACHTTTCSDTNECVPHLINHCDYQDDDSTADDNVDDDSVYEKVCKVLEEEIKLAKENFETIKNKEKKVCDYVQAYQNLCELVTNNSNDVDSSCDNVCRQYSLNKELNNSSCNDHSPLVTTVEDARANKLKISYYDLLNRSSQRIKQLECCHKRLLEYILLVHFNFDEWKQNYLQWIANRQYRLNDIFSPKALSTLQTDRQQQSSTHTITDQMNCDLSKSLIRLPSVSTNSEIIPTPKKHLPNHTKSELSNNRSSPNPSRSGESLQSLINNKNKQRVSLKPDEVNCSLFVQAVLHSKPTDEWANPIYIKSAFDAIDQAKKGIVTCNQIIEALSTKNQYKPLPTDKLIEHAIKQETSKCTCQPKFQPRKIGKDKYCFGSTTRVYLVRFLNSTTIVRVGGGWMSLSEFLDSRDPCRITHKTSQFSNIPPSKCSLTSPRTSSTSKRESNLGLISVTPISKSNTTTSTYTSMNSKKGNPYSSTPLTEKTETTTRTPALLTPTTANTMKKKSN
ncbi:hypothetical protein MN116_002634 [Schistosoma mekongi]|uniref:GAR domain-containing protein n=1 Tax=Schistosoma mekongi TaxID=38744 RepID=A0AAE1ZIC1_SCHME|nr:hypothetical protein MN116_002634 [Schistosoma mekongi]